MIRINLKRACRLGALAAALASCHADAQQFYARLPPQQLGTAALKSVHAQETMHLVVGQSTILRGIVLKRVYVSNPAILQTFTSAPDELVVTAKAPGASSLIVWNAMDVPFMYNVSSDLDPLTLRDALTSEFPNDKIDVKGGQDLLTLTGTVNSKEELEAAGRLAGAYSKSVANSLRIVTLRNRQVELKLQIIEVDRSKLEQFGFNLFRALGNNIGGLSTQQFSSTATESIGSAMKTVTVSNPLNLFFFNSAHNIGATLQDLEAKNVLQILAEPTLTTVSGQEARFLSGGEFPFPVVQGGSGSNTAITIQFRTYGVKMDFTPTVNDDGTIHLKVAPEVSALDFANALTISGFTIPAISTRRAETEVELRDGETFAISGLLDHRTTEILSKMPGISDVPLLGQLFRSKNNTHSVVELVVMVHAHILDPLTTPGKPPVEPKMAVPNLTSSKFDDALHKERPKDVPLPQPGHEEVQP